MKKLWPMELVTFLEFFEGLIFVIVLTGGSAKCNVIVHYYFEQLLIIVRIHQIEQLLDFLLVK